MKFFALAALGALSLMATAEALPWNYVYAQHQAPRYFHASGILATDPLFYNTYYEAYEVPYQYNLLAPYYYTDYYTPYQHNFQNHGFTFVHQSSPFNQEVFEIKGKESKTPIVNVDPINEQYDDKQDDHTELIEEILDDDYEEYKSDQDNASLDGDYEEYEYDVAKIGGRNDSPSRN